MHGINEFIIFPKVKTTHVSFDNHYGTLRFLTFLQKHSSRPETQKLSPILEHVVQGRRKGEGGGERKFIHFLYKVLGKRSVQKETFLKSSI